MKYRPEPAWWTRALRCSDTSLLCQTQVGEWYVSIFYIEHYLKNNMIFDCRCQQHKTKPQAVGICEGPIKKPIARKKNHAIIIIITYALNLYLLCV